MNERYKDFIRDVVITLHMNIKETGERRGFAEPQELTHIEARLQVYHEMLSILRQSAEEFGVEREELGL